MAGLMYVLSRKISADLSPTDRMTVELSSKFIPGEVMDQLLAVNHLFGKSL